MRFFPGGPRGCFPHRRPHRRLGFAPCRLTGIYAPLKTNKTSRATQAVEKSPAARGGAKYVLRLFVAGATARSRQAVRRVRELCDEQLKGGWTLEVIDIYQQPSLACEYQVVATPTLIKELPRPVRRFIGSLSNLGGMSDDLDLGPSEKIAV